MSPRAPLLATLASIALATPALAAVPVLVEEHASVDRTDEPVTLGIPLAPGVLVPGGPVRLVDPDGQPVRAQMRPLSVWEDGSVRWLRCAFAADVAADATATYVLEPGVAHTPSSPLIVVEAAGVITVDTGPLRFEVSTSAFDLFRAVDLDLDGDGAFAPDERILTASADSGPRTERDGRLALASFGAPEAVVIEEAGPETVVIRASGVHDDGAGPLLKWETRIHAFAGQSRVKLYHVAANGKSVASLGFPLDPANDETVDRVALVLPLALDGDVTVTTGGDGALHTAAVAPGDAATLIQLDRPDVTGAPAYELRRASDDALLASGQRAAGWLRIGDGRWGATIGSRDFWQKAPKGIRAAADGTLSLEILPSPTTFHVAMGSGDEVWIDFHGDPGVGAPPGPIAVLLADPLFPRTSPEQYASSEAFGKLPVRGEHGFPVVDAYALDVTTNHLAFQDQGLGHLGHGAVPAYDWGFEPTDVMASGWGGNYYDATVLTPARLFAQTGDRRYAEVLAPAARHYMETHAWNTYDPDDWLRGFAPAYGGYHRGTGHFEQHYGEGVWAYHYLTGDMRAREIGLRAADAIRDRQGWGNENSGCRMAYQRGSASIEAWKATRDASYLDHARHILVELILDTQDPWGMIGGYFTEGGEGVRAEQTFMMALYSDALWTYIRELPDDDPTRPDLVARLALLADFFDVYARKAPGTEDYWNWWEFPPRDDEEPVAVIDWDNPDATVYWNAKPLLVGTYAYAFDLTSAPRYRDLGLALLTDMWERGPQGSDDGRYFWSKISGQLMKAIPHALAILTDDATPIDAGGPVNAPGSIASRTVVRTRPNPFSSRVALEVMTPVAARLSIHDVAGREVWSAPIVGASPGRPVQLTWDGRTPDGRHLSPGRYFHLVRDARSGARLSRGTLLHLR